MHQTEFRVVPFGYPLSTTKYRASNTCIKPSFASFHSDILCPRWSIAFVTHASSRVPHIFPFGTSFVLNGVSRWQWVDSWGKKKRRSDARKVCPGRLIWGKFRWILRHKALLGLSRKGESAKLSRIKSKQLKLMLILRPHPPSVGHIHTNQIKRKGKCPRIIWTETLNLSIQKKAIE